MTNKKIHSEGILTDLRDHWWNADFVTLMAKRWELKKVKSILDVGCGVGHWGQMLVPFLSEDSIIAGVDPEETWIQQATERAQVKGLASRSNYVLGTAEKLPFPDDHFDMVTCQTVLIHVSDVEVALKEMLRVLKPGGLLAVSEPNNVISNLVFNNFSVEDSIDEVIDLVRFSLTHQRGKKNLGEGYASLGDLVPFYFSKVGLKNIKVYLSDLADFFVPPYTTPREKAVIDSADEISKASWDAEKIDSKKYFLAGGGTDDDFENGWGSLVRRTENRINGYLHANISGSGGELMYLVSGRK